MADRPGLARSRRIALLVPWAGSTLIFLIGGATLLMLPSWERPGWLLGLVIAGLVGMMLTINLMVLLRPRLPRPAKAAGIRVQPQMWVIWLQVIVFLVAIIFLIAAGSVVLSASSLGAHPAQTTALRVLPPTCSKCDSRVQYLAEHELWIAPMAGGSSDPAVGDRLVYDAAHPDRAMPYSDWSAGHGSALWGIVGIILGGLTWIQVWVMLGRRRRSRLNTLRPEVLITGARFLNNGRAGERWRISFADGKRATYVNTPELRTALRVRLGAIGALATVGEQERQLLTTDSDVSSVP